MPRIAARDEGPNEKEHEMTDFGSKSLAELHALAAEAGIENFRLMRREQLVAELGQADTPAAGDSSSADAGGDDGNGSRSRRRRGRGGRGRSRRGGGGSDAEDRDYEGGGRHEGDDLTEATGVLERHCSGTGTAW